MRAVLHPLVHVDISEAMEFYSREGDAKLAADFFREVEAVVNVVTERPEPFVEHDELLRRARSQIPVPPAIQHRAVVCLCVSFAA